jgi:hypothetical protein
MVDTDFCSVFGTHFYLLFHSGKKPPRMDLAEAAPGLTGSV